MSELKSIFKRHMAKNSAVDSSQPVKKSSKKNCNGKDCSDSAERSTKQTKKTASKTKDCK